jgi:hypothetical protein
MNQDPPNQGPPPQDDDERPIRGLADLETNVSPDLPAKVRRSIQRRTTAAQFAHFSWSFPGVILMEFITLLVHLFSVADGRKGKS